MADTDKSISISDVSFVHLNSDLSVDLSKFTCEEEDLCDFLANDAINDSKDCYSTTHLVMYNGEIAGYFSLVSDTVELSHGVKRLFGIDYRYGKYIPALKIARLARSDRFKGKGLGDVMFQKILSLSYSQSKISAFRVLTVDAKDNEMALKYYKKNGFQEGAKKRGTVAMYLDVSGIIASFRESEYSANHKLID